MFDFRINPKENGGRRLLKVREKDRKREIIILIRKIGKFSELIPKNLKSSNSD